MTIKYFFDSYAIISLIESNDNYLPYLDCEIIINEFVYAEICYYLERVNHSRKELLMQGYSEFVYSTDLEVIKKAMVFRNKWKKRKVSMADCIGYLMAEEFGVKFLTGDKEFKNMENVEFVK